MEPIEQYFDNVKRSALVLKPQQPFFDWLITNDPTEKIEDLITESDVYLLPDYETVEEMEKWLKKNFDRIFSEQLNNWYVDDSLWPQKRNFKMFQQWFSCSLHTLVWDTQHGFIEKI
jgi:hypothetical protein